MGEKTLFYALTCCEKNSFNTHTHLLCSTTSLYRGRGKKKNEGEKIIRWNENRKEKQKEHYICILTSHSKLLESYPTSASIQAACQ